MLFSEVRGRGDGNEKNMAYPPLESSVPPYPPNQGHLFPLPRGDHGQHQSARRSQRRCGTYFRARGSKQAPQDNGKTCSGLRSSGRRCGATRYGAEALWMLVPIWGPRCMLQLKAVVKR